MDILITYQNQINNYSTESFIKNSFKKLNINCIFIKTDHLIKNINKYGNYICLYNIKNNTDFIKILKKSNLKIYGYTFDLINYKNLYHEDRQSIMEYNINHIKTSFIVEDSYNYKNIINKCIHIFQPTKVLPYNITNSISNKIQFIHFGRLNNSRINKIIKISETFPNINIYLYGYTESILVKINRKNIHYKNHKFIEGLEMYLLTRNNNTFILSFSEIPKECYYSNRIPMLLGYNALVIQEKFKNIEKYFNDREMIIYSNMKELENKVTHMINNFKEQNILRKNGLECSKKYSFDNYVYTLIDNLYN